MATKKDKSIKPAWIVCGMDSNPLCNDNGEPVEHRSERAAVKAATAHIQTSEDDEAWVFKLSHVVSRPPIEPVIDAID